MKLSYMCRWFAISLLLVAAAAYVLFDSVDTGQAVPAPVAASAHGNEDWPTYGGDPGHRQYSPLQQIHRGNVAQLREAWRYASAAGEALPETSELQVNPLIVDGVLYGISPNYTVFALNAGDGSLRWEFDPLAALAAREDINATLPLMAKKRGFARWRKGDNHRLFFGVGHFLFAIDADTGEPVADFGNGSVLDLRDGLGRPAESLSVSGSTPGAVYKDLLIVGSAVGENASAAPGDVRAFDVRTGALRWTFHTIPLPGEPGAETWPDNAREQHGGTNIWAGISIDQARGLVFLPVGSPSNDFVGDERPGSNLYGNSVLALDAATGELRWHYQLVHHDLWDRDVNSAPTLITVNRDGRPVDAVAQTTKQGYVYVFDRETGEPLFPIREVPVPPSQRTSEQAWPTQPLPVSPPPFARQKFDETDLSDISPEAHAYVLGIYRRLQPAQTYAPFDSEPRIMMPGYDGGATWGGPAWSPKANLLVINAQNRPATGQVKNLHSDGSPGSMLYLSACTSCHGVNREGIEGAGPSLTAITTRYNDAELADIIRNGRGRMLGLPIPAKWMALLLDFLRSAPASGTEGTARPTFTGYNRFVDHEGYPAVKPPWGTLTAIDLDSGSFAWQTVLGEHEELSRRGIPQTGTLNYGGPVATAGGLVFIAATMDSRLRAFDIETGDELWQATLPAPAFATPAVYAVDGQQFVVVACGGGKLGTAPGDSYVAFSLPTEGRSDGR